MESGADQVLKAGIKRTVTVESVDGVQRVVKKFHARGRLDRFKDWARAHREFRSLNHLRAHGLPVPAPVAVRKRDGCWELVQERVSDGIPLDALFRGDVPWPVQPRTVARNVGRLMAEIIQQGVQHPDLHAGNVLVDGSGGLHLVDVARAGTGRGVDAQAMLTALASGTRETTTGHFRALVLRSFLEANPKLAWRDRGRQVEEIEASARRRRREEVAGRAARYWRDSGVFSSFERGGRRGFLRKGLDEELCDLLAITDLQSLPHDRRMESVSVSATSVRFLAARWEAAARLEMHGLQAERPLVIYTHPSPRAVFERPVGSDRLEARWSRLAAPERVLAAHGAGQLMGGLEDRGLSIGAPEASGLALTKAGHLFLQAASVHEAHEPQPAHVLGRWRRVMGSVSTVESDAFALGFASAFLGTRSERAAIERDLYGA